MSHASARELNKARMPMRKARVDHWPQITCDGGYATPNPIPEGRSGEVKADATNKQAKRVRRAGTRMRKGKRGHECLYEEVWQLHQFSLSLNFQASQA